jgi:hypothetical protein
MHKNNPFLFCIGNSFPEKIVIMSFRMFINNPRTEKGRMVLFNDLTSRMPVGD